MSIRVGIVGYGNLAKGVEASIKENSDMSLVAIFTRRDPSSVKINTENVPVLDIAKAEDYKDMIDVLIICGGSATDLPEQTPHFAKYFNVVDSFDTHAKIPQHFENVDNSAKESGKVGIISVGWDPGMFSLNRLYGNVVLPNGKTILSGAKVLVRVTLTLYAELVVSRTQNSIQSLLKVRLIGS